MTQTKVSLRLSDRRQHTAGMTRFILLVLLLLALAASAADARNTDHGGDGNTDVRVAGVCSRGATAALRVRAQDGGIEIRFRLRQTNGRGAWRITVVHENRIASRVTVRTTANDDSVEVRSVLTDLPGSDAVVVHAWGPRGLVCRATATLPAHS